VKNVDDGVMTVHLLLPSVLKWHSQPDSTVHEELQPSLSNEFPSLHLLLSSIDTSEQVFGILSRFYR
jgi:hypothetical protein